MAYVPLYINFNITGFQSKKAAIEKSLRIEGLNLFLFFNQFSCHELILVVYGQFWQCIKTLFLVYFVVFWMSIHEKLNFSKFAIHLWFLPFIKLNICIKYGLKISWCRFSAVFEKLILVLRLFCHFLSLWPSKQPIVTSLSDLFIK